MIDVYDLPQDIRVVSLRQGLCKNIDSAETPSYFTPGALPADETVYFRNITPDQLKNALTNNNYKRILLLVRLLLLIQKAIIARPLIGYSYAENSLN